MTFQHLLDGAEVLSQSGDPSVSGVEYDSRRVKPGCVFVAMRGETSDGNRFIDQAIQAGAVAVVTDSATEKPREGVAWAVVPHGRRALARVSENFYKRPAERIAITGITGTNGKSTTAFLIESILTAAGRKSALIGTIEYHVAGKVYPAPHTTPEALELARLFNEALGLGATDAVMEVSSHALAQERVFGVPFDVAVFTNLTRDHLDYHKTMDEYFAAKRVLFEGCGTDAPRAVRDQSRRRIWREAGGVQPQAQRGRADLWLGARRLSRRERGHQPARHALRYGHAAGGEDSDFLSADRARECVQHSGRGGCMLCARLRVARRLRGASSRSRMCREDSSASIAASRSR